MAQYQLIRQQELTGYAEAIVRHGGEPSDFELQEDVFDPATAEVESALGEVAVKCLKTDAVATYRVGPGLDWVRDFEDDLREGRMGGRIGSQG